MAKVIIHEWFLLVLRHGKQTFLATEGSCRNMHRPLPVVLAVTFDLCGLRFRCTYCSLGLKREPAPFWKASHPSKAVTCQNPKGSHVRANRTCLCVTHSGSWLHFPVAVPCSYRLAVYVEALWKCGVSEGLSKIPHHFFPNNKITKFFFKNKKFLIVIFGSTA